MKIGNFEFALGSMRTDSCRFRYDKFPRMHRVESSEFVANARDPSNPRKSSMGTALEALAEMNDRNELTEDGSGFSYRLPAGAEHDILEYNIIGSPVPLYITFGTGRSVATYLTDSWELGDNGSEKVRLKLDVGSDKLAYLIIGTEDGRRFFGRFEVLSAPDIKNGLAMTEVLRRLSST